MLLPRSALELGVCVLAASWSRVPCGCSRALSRAAARPRVPLPPLCHSRPLPPSAGRLIAKGGGRGAAGGGGSCFSRALVRKTSGESPAVPPCLPVTPQGSPPVATSGHRGFGCAARGLAAAPSSLGERQVRASLLSLPSHKPVLTPRCCFLAGSSPVSHRLPLLSPCVQVLDQNVAPQHLRGRWRGQCRSCLGRQGGGVVISGLKSQALVTSTAVETLRLWHLVPGLG